MATKKKDEINVVEEAKKKPTAKKTTTKKKEEVVNQENKSQKEITINDIPPELMNQMFAMFQQMQSKNETSVVTEKDIEKPKKLTKSYLRTIKDREVVVRSVAGVVSFKSPKTNTLYKWMEIGDEEVLTVDEILTMDSTSRRFLNTPWLVLEDEEVIQSLGLSDLYKLIEKVEDVDNLLEMDMSEIEEVIDKAPHEYKKTLSSVLFNKVNNNEIRDIVLIKKLEDILGTTLLI